MPGSYLLSGLILGLGVCGVHCVFFLAPVTARTAAHWKQGVGAALLFGLGKVTVLSLYGALAAAAGGLVYRLISHELVTFAAGLVLAALGVWFLLKSGRCGRLARSASPLLLGVVDGLIPCSATTGLLLSIAALGSGIVHGVVAGFLFGLGTVAGPLLLICGVTPWLWSKVARFRHSGLLLRLLGAAVFFFWSFLLLANGGVP
jgi:hypothetical protein